MVVVSGIVMIIMKKYKRIVTVKITISDHNNNTTSTDFKASHNTHMGEYSCRCHGKRVISAPSKPLKLKLAGHIL